MSDALEPPAKRARLEMDAPVASASDVPGSPVDDMDDDFYDTTPVKPAPVRNEYESGSLSAAAASAPVSLNLPGLGSVNDTPAAQPPSHSVAQDQADDASEDGEISDGEAFYNDSNTFAAPGANLEQAAGVPQPGKLSHSELPAVTLTTSKEDAAVKTETHESDDAELDAALAAAIDMQNGTENDTAMTNTGADEAKAEFLRAAEANKDDKNAEWQLDSDASDSDSSSDSSSDDSDEGSDEGELLDPEEAVRLLMAEATDEAGPDKVKVKTQNEVEEEYEKPDITITDSTKITELGLVESVVDNILVVKAKTSGDYQVLESGSALCLQNRTVIGKISEQIGRVEEPRYSVGFSDATEIETLGIAKDTPIFYVDEHSTFVFTEPLRAQKHTDASNLHDEETNEVEFSDDEKEMEFKKEQKAKKRARAEDKDEPPKPIPTGPRAYTEAPSYVSTQYQGGGLKYSDDEDEDLGMYKPLARPDHFEQIVGQGAPLEDRSHVRRGGMRGRGGWGDRGRGFRGRGGHGGGRGDFGGGRGDRAGSAGLGGRGDRAGGGNRSDRGGKNNNNNGPNRGDKGQNDRGRQQDQFHGRQHDQHQDKRQRNGSQHDGGRSATSASPARQQHSSPPTQPRGDRGHSQSHQNQHQNQQGSAKPKNKNRKQRQREKRERERERERQERDQQHSQHQSPPAPSGPPPPNPYAAASNTQGWPGAYANPSPPAPYAQAAPPPPPPAAATAYVNPAYNQQAPAQGQQNQQANLAAWAQWFQVVGAMSQQQAPQAPQYAAPAQVPPPPPPQVQAPPAYPYQQYMQPQGQGPAPQQTPQQYGNQANAQQSLQDILRALGGAPPQ